MAIQEKIDGIRNATLQNKVTPPQLADCLQEIYDEETENSESSRTGQSITANVNVGGVTSGKVYSQGTSGIQILQDVLLAYIVPIASVSVNNPLLEDGSVEAVTITFGATNGSHNITKIELYKGASLISTKTSAGFYTYSDSISADTTYTCKVYDEHSGISTPAVTTTTDVKFVDKYFIGCTIKGVLPTDSMGVRSLDTYTGYINGETEVCDETEKQATEYNLVVCTPLNYRVRVNNLYGSIVEPKTSDHVLVTCGIAVKAYQVIYYEGTLEYKNIIINQYELH